MAPKGDPGACLEICETCAVEGSNLTDARHVFVNPSCTPAPLNTWAYEMQYNDVETNLGGCWGRRAPCRHGAATRGWPALLQALPPAPGALACPGMR